ncbi:hypothetical protein AXG93_1976s1470 [Marchantia polymorpha subsp. ruderalis]|uniref:Uncharacterized protein n=1 Tax=Marchantia polymorpha subsp. ruderalis TaxID=1480154 RepID=A0A176VDR4_MARPO|nr:hypothetical protein AXG93_1976s1470 [Marchantia polymorpha subsp. ruderalis]
MGRAEQDRQCGQGGQADEPCVGVRAVRFDGGPGPGPVAGKGPVGSGRIQVGGTDGAARAEEREATGGEVLRRRGVGFMSGGEWGRGGAGISTKD